MIRPCELTLIGGQYCLPRKSFSTAWQVISHNLPRVHTCQLPVTEQRQIPCASYPPDANLSKAPNTVLKSFCFSSLRQLKLRRRPFVAPHRAVSRAVHTRIIQSRNDRGPLLAGPSAGQRDRLTGVSDGRLVHQLLLFSVTTHKHQVLVGRQPRFFRSSFSSISCPIFDRFEAREHE